MSLTRTATAASRLLTLLRDGQVEIATRDPAVEHQVAQALDDIEQALDNTNTLPDARPTSIGTRLCVHCTHHAEGIGYAGMRKHICHHADCRHPVTGSPLDCSVARAANRAPQDIHGIEFCGPGARHFEPKREA